MLLLLGIIGLILLIAVELILIVEIYERKDGTQFLATALITIWMSLIGAMTQTLAMTIIGTAMGVISWLIILVIIVHRPDLTTGRLVAGTALITLIIAGLLITTVFIWKENVECHNTPAEITRIHKVTQEVQVPYGIKYFETEDGDTIILNLKNDNRMDFEGPYLGPISR